MSEAAHRAAQIDFQTYPGVDLSMRSMLPWPGLPGESRDGFAAGRGDRRLG